jgi:NADPH:quinone reductase-like Zn-dependent oxidoreductase
MSQLILTSVGDADESVRLDDHPDLTPGPGDVLVAMEAATLNDTDFRFAAGRYAVPPLLPSVMGTEGVGRVLAAGPEADQSLVGRRVILLPTPTYQQGSWADQAVIPAGSVVPVGDQGDPLQLAMLAMNPPTADLLLRRFVSLRPGDWVGQNQGNSAVGQYVIGLARHAGLRTVSVVRREAAAEQLRALGGDIVLVDGDGLGDQIAAALGTDRLRLVLDGVGGPTPGDLARSLEFGGTVVSYASATGQPAMVPARDLIFRDLQVRGFWLVNWLRTAPRAEIEETYARLDGLLRQGILHAAVAGTYPLGEYRAAFAQARSAGRPGKVLFTFPPGRPA